MVSHDGKGLSAISPDTAAGMVRISLMGDRGRSDFRLTKRVHFGRYDENTGSYVMDPKMVAILEANVGREVSRVKLRVERMVKALKVPGDVRIVEPSSNLPDWGEVSVRWEGRARRYLLRLYAFTMMDQKDEIVLADSTHYVFDLGNFYGDGFLSVAVCPIEGSDPRKRERIKVYALGRCVSRTILVGDTSVWEGEMPEPPWNEDDLLWYLLMM